MFYEVEVRSHVRVSPTKFSEHTETAVFQQLTEQYEDYVSKELGVVIGVTAVNHIGEGIIIPGDGAAYYDATYTLLTYKPELQELVVGKVSEISDFGAFITIGPLDGMVHVSQTMDDYVTFAKSNVLTGKQSKRTLKIGDLCRARVIAVSYKDMHNPKIGLTMRQPLLGKLDWIKEDVQKKNAPKIPAGTDDEKKEKGKVKK